MNKAIFLDRDGTINVDTNYVYKLEDLTIIKGTKEWLEIFKKLWYLLIIITNQSWIWWGYYTIEDTNILNKELEKRLGLQFDAIYICPHTKEHNCNCRKPKTTNILKAKKIYNINLEESFFIWDKESDISCWEKAGCKTVLIQNEQYHYTNTTKPDYLTKNVLDFSNIIRNDP